MLPPSAVYIDAGENVIPYLIVFILFNEQFDKVTRFL